MFGSYVVLLIFTSLLWQHGDAKYARYTSLRMRHKIVKMDLELCMDSEQKIRAIRHMRKEYSRTSSFQIARLIYDIRRKYARMIFVYFKSLDGLEKLDSVFHLDHLREIQHLAFEIDHMVKAIEEYEDRKLRKKRITRMGRPPEEEEDAETEAERRKKERLKQRAYVERKKMLWSLRQGNSRDNLGRAQFQHRDIVEEGFESDSFI